VQFRRAPAASSRSFATTYWGFEERTDAPLRRREGPGAGVAVIVSFEQSWLIDGERRTSFAGGLRRSQVTTEHQGRSHGMHVELVPWAARALFGVPMHELADTTVALDALLPGVIVRRLESAGDWPERFDLADDLLARRIAGAVVDRGVVWAWETLRESHGRAPIATLAAELGWSRKRLVARFRDQIGLPPKAAARLFRFERARTLAGTVSWAELAHLCGFADQPHLISEFRAFTGRTPATFLQDELRAHA
jgi:AraC-like DNA-binding protein